MLFLSISPPFSLAPRRWQFQRERRLTPAASRGSKCARTGWLEGREIPAPPRTQVVSGEKIAHNNNKRVEGKVTRTRRRTVNLIHTIGGAGWLSQQQKNVRQRYNDSSSRTYLPAGGCDGHCTVFVCWAGKAVASMRRTVGRSAGRSEKQLEPMISKYSWAAAVRASFEG